VSGEDVEVVRRFRAALRDDDRETAAALLAPDVEWVVSKKRTLHGVDEVANFYLGKSSGGPENLDVEFDPGELEDGGGGRVSAVNHQIFRWKESGELAYERRARIDYTIRDGRIVRYEATLLDE
jgi:ketosteroid isomerase-like protein